MLTVSDADAGSRPARLADKVIRIGSAPAADSYLNVDAVVAAALAAGVDAVHPGYGFLSENARLARACAAAGVVFIGPAPETLEAAGDKLAAREHALAAGLPVLPGGRISPGGHGPALSGPGGHKARMDDGSEAAGATPCGATRPKGRDGAGASEEVGALAEPGRGLAGRIGFPVLVKAAGGGGGRGLRVVRGPGELADAVSVASAEAGAAFGDPRVYLERYVERGRHVEVQILGDGERVIHLGDRDCSVQRRYQKLIEEAPAPGLDAGPAGPAAGGRRCPRRQLGYRGAGTVEFLVDADRGEFYFLEVNARIQVEHPVTEAITGLDIVAEQIAIAEGRPLRLRQADVRVRGPRDRVPDQRRGPGPRLPSEPGTVSRAVFPVGRGRSGFGWIRMCRRGRGSGLLRLAAGQGDRPRR